MIFVSSILMLTGLVGLGAAVAVAYVVLVARQGGTNARAVAGQTPVDQPVAPPPSQYSLRAVVDQLVAARDDEMTFLDCASGRFIRLKDEFRAELESDEPLEDSFEFTKAQLEQLRHRLKSKELLPLPTKADTKEFMIQERFCEELPEGEAKDQMRMVQQGHAGFRSFDGAVQRLGIEAQWHVLRDAEFAKTAMDWMQRHELPVDHDMPLDDEPGEELRQAS